MSLIYNNTHTPKEDRDLWRTPKPLFDTLNKEFCFNVDVAADENNNLCNQYFTEDDNALLATWGKSNWCNPPYSKVKPWVRWARVQHEAGKTIVMLVNAETSSTWFKEAFDSCNEVRFISGRIAFINNSTGKPQGGNSKGQVLFIWRAHCKSHCVSLIDREDLYRTQKNPPRITGKSHRKTNTGIIARTNGITRRIGFKYGI